MSNIYRFKGIMVALSIAVGVAGCAQFEKLRGTGGGTDDYKDSPCACGPLVPQHKPEALYAPV